MEDELHLEDIIIGNNRGLITEKENKCKFIHYVSEKGNFEIVCISKTSWKIHKVKEIKSFFDNHRICCADRDTVGNNASPTKIHNSRNIITMFHNSYCFLLQARNLTISHNSYCFLLQARNLTTIFHNSWLFLVTSS